jgi:hypothetical protein
MIDLGPTQVLYLRANDRWYPDQRKDEDPRHQWRRVDIPHSEFDALVHCERCDRSSLELANEWLRREGIDWNEAALWVEGSDPKGRTLFMARKDFENSQCEGERRSVADRWVP